MEVQVHQLMDIFLQVGSFCFAPRFCESNPIIAVNGHVLHCSIGICAVTSYQAHGLQIQYCIYPFFLSEHP